MRQNLNSNPRQQVESPGAVNWSHSLADRRKKFYAWLLDEREKLKMCYLQTILKAEEN